MLVLCCLVLYSYYFCIGNNMMLFPYSSNANALRLHAQQYDLLMPLKVYDVFMFKQLHSSIRPSSQLQCIFVFDLH
jgi:hypothetical protein